MKTSLLKEVRPPNAELRAEILVKLAKLRGMKNFQAKKTLRLALKRCDGKTFYFLKYKTLKILLGDETTSKRRFLLRNKPDFIGPYVRKYRADLKKSNSETPVQVYVGDTRISYSKRSGVIVGSNVFGKAFVDVSRKRVFKYKSPETSDSYVGIELEYATNLFHEEIADLLIKNKLHRSVRIMNDSSIKPTKTHPYRVELCVLTKTKELSATLSKLQLVISGSNNFATNDSCGLHIHLDMRHRNPKLAFKNLVSMQSVLFQMTKEERRNNPYCVPVTEPIWDNCTENHYAAISKHSFYKHNTIEIRIHHSTIDLTVVEKWINLLNRIADYGGDDLVFGSLDHNVNDLRTKIKIEPSIYDYIKKGLEL